MTHRHKNQTDEYEIELVSKEELARREREYLAAAEIANANRARRGRSTGPTDSNHDSRTDSTSKGGKA